MKLSKVIIDQDSQDGIKPMNQMEPLEVCVICDTTPDWKKYEGTIVMRTASSTSCEVMNLSFPKVDGCWHELSTLLVKPYTGKSITFILK